MRKGIIVCPNPLCVNWQREIKKWLGDERCRSVLVTSELSTQAQRSEIATFRSSKVIPILIIGYEMFRKHDSQLQDTEEAVIFCDEGHRLKVNQQLTRSHSGGWDCNTIHNSCEVCAADA